MQSHVNRGHKSIHLPVLAAPVLINGARVRQLVAADGAGRVFGLEDVEGGD